MRYFPKPIYKVYSKNGQECLEVLEDITYILDDFVVIVPQGFVCDGASVPRFFKDFICPQIDSRTVAAAILHDYIYRTPHILVSRANADYYFYKFSRMDGFPFGKASLAYLGVRIGGASSYVERLA